MQFKCPKCGSPNVIIRGNKVETFEYNLFHDQLKLNYDNSGVDYLIDSITCEDCKYSEEFDEPIWHNGSIYNIHDTLMKELL